MNRLKMLLKSFLSDLPMLLNLLRIIKDKRYLYHILQGFFTEPRSRNFLRKIERLFFKKRVKISSNISDIELYKRNFKAFLKNGIMLNPIKIDSLMIQNIKQDLENKLCHDPENSDLNYFLINKKSPKVQRAYYRCEDLARIPGVLEIANNPLLLGYASKYFGALPSIDSIYAWWSFPTENRALTQSYHRDIDTLHQLKFFVYLTDVDYESGPHIYIKRSKDISFSTTKDQLHQDDQIETSFTEDKLVILGSEGSNFLGDMFAFHKGLMPESEPRLLLQIYYSLKRTPFGPKKPFVRENEIDISQLGKHYREVNKYIII